jgi:hypothetical protein
LQKRKNEIGKEEERRRKKKKRKKRWEKGKETMGAKPTKKNW